MALRPPALRRTWLFTIVTGNSPQQSLARMS